MSIESYQFRSAPYWLGFVFAGQAFTVSCREVIPAYGTKYIQISTGKEKITHITNRKIISGREQLGIKLIQNPSFIPGRRKIPTVNLDGRSRIQADTLFFSDASQVSGGSVLEETFIPMFGYSQGGVPVESSLFERILLNSTHFILALTNEGNYPNAVSINLAFYESEN